jgi:hypothetical protein
MMRATDQPGSPGARGLSSMHCYGTATTVIRWETGDPLQSKGRAEHEQDHFIALL